MKDAYLSSGPGFLRLVSSDVIEEWKQVDPDFGAELEELVERAKFDPEFAVELEQAVGAAKEVLVFDKRAYAPADENFVPASKWDVAEVGWKLGKVEK